MCSDFLSGDCPGFGQQGKGFWSSFYDAGGRNGYASGGSKLGDNHTGPPLH